MKAISHIVTNLDNWESLQPLIKKLGTLHATKDISEAKYARFGKAILKMIEEVVGTKLTPESKKAWLTVYTALISSMQKEKVPQSSPPV
mmetsp:Transcript_12402/g.19376  ORF Transcript_12402/g.19376 Transcript_12402/m.19376 type:complete len:89 (+) Transcript_12402:1615-1881(+)